jgi:OOP family OmpA-OmpF porin
MAHFATKEKKLRPFALIGAGGMSISSSEPATVYNDEDFVLHGGIGVKYALADNWGLRVDVRALLPPSSASESITTDVEATLGLYTQLPFTKTPPPPKDSDEDGLTDDVDQCPTEAEDKDGFQDEDGCPDNDNDADGVPDASDSCKNEAEDKDGFQDEDGCPDNDNDADGVPDSDDKCPMKAEDKDGFQDEDGCEELDNDNDQILDTNDQCPNEAEDVDGFQDEDGCPDPDNDGDGVLDANDKCPTEQESKNGFQDEDGCPDVIPRALQRFTGTIKGITFETGKDVIRRASYNTLNKAIKVMQDFPDTRIEVSGHTDDVGDDNTNLQLSQARAASVVKYMVDKGIPAERLESKGFGETRPASPITDDKGNALKGFKLKKARSANRRVEFKLLSALTAEPEAATTPAPEAAPAPQ